MAFPVFQYYTKNLKGECEPDYSITYYNLAGCEADNTRPTYDTEFDRWIAIQAISNDDDMFFELAPTDRVEFLKIRYGIRVSPNNSYPIGLPFTLTTISHCIDIIKPQSCPILRLN
jgi:hypothetical protein